MLSVHGDYLKLFKIPCPDCKVKSQQRHYNSLNFALYCCGENNDKVILGESLLPLPAYSPSRRVFRART